MLRTKLVAACAACIGLILVMAGLLYWGPARIERQLERSLWAHQQAEGYLRLSSDAFEQFWQLADALIARYDEASAAAKGPSSEFLGQMAT